MTTSTLEIYTLLVNAGVKEKEAKPLAEQIISREEAKEFATKTDLNDVKRDLTLEIQKARTATIMWVVGFQIAGFAFIAAAALS